MRVEKRIVLGPRTVGYIVREGDNRVAITRNDGIMLGKTGIFSNVTFSNNCLVFTDGNSFRDKENTLRVSEKEYNSINWTPASDIMEHAKSSPGVSKKAKIIGGIFNSLDGVLLGYRLRISNGSEIRKSLKELKEESKHNSLSYTLHPEQIEQYKNDFHILKRNINGGILFYYIELLDRTLTKKQLDLLYGSENNILEEVRYDVPQEIASKIASMTENEYIKTLINKTNKLASITELKINLKGKTLKILGRCGMGNLYSTLESLNDYDNKKSNTLVGCVGGYTFIIPKRDVKEFWKSNVDIKIQSDKILNVSSLYKSLVTNTDNEASIIIKKKQLSNQL